MQRVPELMKERLNLAKCQQGRSLSGRLCQVHHHRDVGTYVFSFPVDTLSLIRCHPRTALLAFARMEVGIEYGEIRAILVEHLIGLDIRMIDRDVLILLKGDAVEAVGQSEDAVNDLRQFEVGT